MRYFIGVIIGYLLGMLSPTYLFSVIKNVDMRKSGTGNLGATNAMLTLGKKFGILVMIFDIMKSFVPVLIYKMLYPEEPQLMMAMGLSAIVGHCFPFYLKFRGGKGVATLAGLVLAYDPLIFLVLFIVGFSFVFLTGYVFSLPISGSAIFPVLVGLKTRNLVCIILSACAGLVVIVKHSRNFKRIFDGTEMRWKDFVKKRYKIDKVKKKDK